MYQRTTVIGHVGGEVQMRYTPSGVPVTSFSVATSRKWTGADGQAQEKTTWFRVTTWQKLAETCAQYVKKGMLVLVEGEIDASAFSDREGNARASLELTAQTVRFLSRADDGHGAGEPARAAAHEDAEIPF